VGHIRLNRELIIRPLSLMALLASACGSSGTTSAASSPTPVPSPTVVVATISVAGASEQVLTTPAGLTLYYLTSDNSTAPKCTAACLTHWPPLVSTGTPALPSGVSGTLTVVQNGNGSQVAYNGHLLYGFANDAAQGDSKGEGIQAFGGTWHAATPGLTPM
jgi:predicted lipoprotein with Yx(FWY)xxD motif